MGELVTWGTKEFLRGQRRGWRGLGATTRVEGIGGNDEGEGLLSRALELLVKVDGVATGDGFRGFPLK
jgi:hypothetical protein